MRALFASLIAFNAVITPALANGSADSFDITVTTRPITTFRIGADQTQFGPLEFAGGVEMLSQAREFGAISGLSLGLDQTRLTAVTDTGLWLQGRLERQDGRVTGLSEMRMRPITDANGETYEKKWHADAEGLADDGRGNMLVSFEHRHRIETHGFDADSGNYRFASSVHPPVPAYELRRNQGFESIAFAPVSSQLPGALVGVTEMSLDRNGNIMGFVDPLEGPSFEFSVSRDNEFAITDMDFLPNGDLVILERRFAAGQGIAMRLRLVDDADITPGATVMPVTILEAGLIYQIDNMEALSITTDPDGTPRLTLMSDDNLSLFQRNLLLEFRWTEALD